MLLLYVQRRGEKRRITVLQDIQILPPRKKIGIITDCIVIDIDSDDDDDVVTVVISDDCEVTATNILSS